MESEGLLSPSQEFSSGRYPKSDESSPFHTILVLL
jgi:hypothetical protein